MEKDQNYFNPPDRHWHIKKCSLDNFRTSSDLEKKL
jgi:hypothetical protein